MNETSRALLAETISEIGLPSEAWAGRARTHLDSLTKPIGSLGRLEDIAAQLVSIRRERFAVPQSKAVYVFAADHGVTAEGVSAYPSEVTRQMVLNFLSGGAAVSVLARLHGVAMNVVDVGVDADFGDLDGLRHCKVRKGTRNMLREAAMTDEEMTAALEVGLSMAAEAKAKGHDLVAVGEMGIGNTTAASAITSLLTRRPVGVVTGRGTGLNDSAYAHKCVVIDAAMMRHFGTVEADEQFDPLEVLRRVGGLEIAAMTGFVLGAARDGIAIVLDGFISTAAAAVAFAVQPKVRRFLFAGHQSEEPGHRALLETIGLAPVLTLGMRLGEGSGAVLAMPVIESAMALYTQMATFSSAGVSGAQE